MKIYPDKMEFGWDEDNGIGEILIQQIINKQKTATCSFKIEYTQSELKELYETKGKIVTVVDKNGVARCNIKILDIFETPFGTPDLRLVKGEGDGGDIKKFQDDHRKAWNQTLKNIPLTEDTILIAELFELVEIA